MLNTSWSSLHMLLLILLSPTAMKNILLLLLSLFYRAGHWAWEGWVVPLGLHGWSEATPGPEHKSSYPTSVFPPLLHIASPRHTTWNSFIKNQVGWSPFSFYEPILSGLRIYLPVCWCILQSVYIHRDKSRITFSKYYLWLFLGSENCGIFTFSSVSSESLDCLIINLCHFTKKNNKNHCSFKTERLMERWTDL